jgi:hypothetical protein
VRVVTNVCGNKGVTNDIVIASQSVTEMHCDGGQEDFTCFGTYRDLRTEIFSTIRLEKFSHRLERYVYCKICLQYEHWQYEHWHAM